MTRFTEVCTESSSKKVRNNIAKQITHKNHILNSYALLIHSLPRLCRSTTHSKMWKRKGEIVNKKMILIGVIKALTLKGRWLPLHRVRWSIAMQRYPLCTRSRLIADATVTLHIFMLTSVVNIKGSFIGVLNQYNPFHTFFFYLKPFT